MKLFFIKPLHAKLGMLIFQQRFLFLDIFSIDLILFPVKAL